MACCEMTRQDVLHQDHFCGLCKHYNSNFSEPEDYCYECYQHSGSSVKRCKFEPKEGVEMAQYASSTHGAIEISEMHNNHIINAINKLKREGYVSAKAHRMAFLSGINSEEVNQIKAAKPSKQIDELEAELAKREPEFVGDGTRTAI